MTRKVAGVWVAVYSRNFDDSQWNGIGEGARKTAGFLTGVDTYGNIELEHLPPEGDRLESVLGPALPHNQTLIAESVDLDEQTIRCKQIVVENTAQQCDVLQFLRDQWGFSVMGDY